MPNPGMTETQGLSKEYKLVGLNRCDFQAITVKSGENLAKGTVVAVESTGKLVVAYNDGGSGGAEIARGILDLDVDASAANCAGNMLIKGVVAEDQLTGFDAAAAVDMKGRVVFDKTDLGLDLG